MTVKRRYVFGGSATGFSAPVRNPGNQDPSVYGASSIPVIGGVSVSKVVPEASQQFIQVGNNVQFASAETNVAGEFIGLARGTDSAQQTTAHADPAARTTVTASVTGLTVGGRITLGLTQVGLVQDSAQGQGPELQSPIRLNGNKIEGVIVDGKNVRIILDEDFFNQFDTMDKLIQAHQSNPGRLPWLHLFSNTAADQIAVSGGTAFTTIVKGIEWENARKPDGLRDLDRNSFYLPGFGSVFFGEIFVSKHSKRLTMARFQLEATTGGKTLSPEETEAKPSDSFVTEDASGSGDSGDEMTASGGESKSQHWPE